jgi:hypothetical protein
MAITATTNPANRIEFGDFQTPRPLALAVCRLVKGRGFRPKSVLEPTCGTGTFLIASLEAFSELERAVGYEINRLYSEAARREISSLGKSIPAKVFSADFFATDWNEVFGTLPEPILIVGNPPWVTNSGLGVLKSANVPEKSNVDGLRGIHALTGGSNFDISEWMLRTCIECLSKKRGLMAMLCKTSVARKVLNYVWKTGVHVKTASIYRIDAQENFGAAVDACLLLIETEDGFSSHNCAQYPSITDSEPTNRFGYRESRLVADIELYERWGGFRGDSLGGWRSGIKHDCSKVFELKRENGSYINGFGESVQVESSLIHPLLKSSDLAASRDPHRWVLVPQRTMSDEPERLRRDAPQAWKYLNEHAGLLDKRGSSIYKNRPRFCIFGIGEYSYAPWKVAISGLYKKLTFNCIAPCDEKPVFFDDTCYFYACKSRHEAELLLKMLRSEAAIGFLSSSIFWDSKRPITATVLNSLDLLKLGKELAIGGPVLRALADRQIVRYQSEGQQMLLFREKHSLYRSKKSGQRKHQL